MPQKTVSEPQLLMLAFVSIHIYIIHFEIRAMSVSHLIGLGSTDGFWCELQVSIFWGKQSYIVVSINKNVTKLCFTHKKTSEIIFVLVASTGQSVGMHLILYVTYLRSQNKSQ